MSTNYAKGQPMGNNGVPLFDCPPAVTAIATNARDNATSSSILILTQNTTAIEVGAQGGPAFIKWLAQSVVDSSVAGTSVISAAGTANFDHMIAAGEVRRFVVPINIVPASAQSVQGANSLNGLFPNVAYKTAGIASVLVTQYGSSNSY